MHAYTHTKKKLLVNKYYILNGVNSRRTFTPTVFLPPAKYCFLQTAVRPFIDLALSLKKKMATVEIIAPIKNPAIASCRRKVAEACPYREEVQCRNALEREQ